MTDHDRPEPDDATQISDPPAHETHTSGSFGAARTAPRQPEFVGNYRVVGLLGEGGMGVVWEAEQASPRRRVAVKVIRQGHYVDEVHARMFRREAEMLGRLKHPNIAAIYESGHTEDGHDYFAMELVRGATLKEWLDARTGPLTPKEIDERLRVFRTIAEGVNYAHQRGVIHRDLKPSNIVMATSEDGGPPVVKILDFGLARLTEADTGDATLTREGVIRGTVAYMSPEQARGDVEAIDVRTDVYALGVILYELLSGRRPHDTTKLSLIEAVRTVATTPAPRLADAWRGTKPPDRDLETIVGKALELEPERRYASAGALARDVERYLGRLPIEARPASRAYRASLFVRRHRVGVTAVAAIALLLLAGIAGTTAGLLSALKANRLAAERATELEQVVAFQAAQLSGVDLPKMGLAIRDDLVSDLESSLKGANVPAAEAASTLDAFKAALARTNATSIALHSLDRSVFDGTLKAIETQFAKQPLVKARLLQVLAETLRDVGLPEKAAATQQEALAIRRAQLGEDARDTIYSSAKTVELLGGQTKHKEAEELGKATLERARRVLGPDDRVSIAILGRLAVAIQSQGRWPEAEAIYRERLERARRALGPDDRETLIGIMELSYGLDQFDKKDEAQQLAREALAGFRRVFGNDDPNTLIAINTLGLQLMTTGKFAEAEPLLRESLEGHRRVRGRYHPDTLILVANMAGLYAEQKRWADAEHYDREAFEGFERTLGPDHQYTITLGVNLAIVLAGQKKYEEAERLGRDGWQRSRRVFGEFDPSTVRNLMEWSRFALALNQAAACDGPVTAVAAEFERRPPNSGTARTEVLIRLGQVRLAQKQYAAAEKALLEASRIVSDKEKVRARHAAEVLADVYEEWDKADPGKGYGVKVAHWREVSKTR